MEYKNCTNYYFRKYIEKKLIALKGCSEDFKMENMIFSTFTNLSVYFPDAYRHMLKVWGICEENPTGRCIHCNRGGE